MIPRTPSIKLRLRVCIVDNRMVENIISMVTISKLIINKAIINKVMLTIRLPFDGRAADLDSGTVGIVEVTAAVVAVGCSSARRVAESLQVAVCIPATIFGTERTAVRCRKAGLTVVRCPKTVKTAKRGQSGGIAVTQGLLNLKHWKCPTSSKSFLRLKRVAFSPPR
jgi:hypothetical protein